MGQVRIIIAHRCDQIERPADSEISQ